MEKQTTMQIAIEKIDEKIEIYQFSKLEASKVKDATSMERHHGAKIALVFMRQELVNLLEMEKQQIIDACRYGNNFEQGDLNCAIYYEKTFKNTKE